MAEIELAGRRYLVGEEYLQGAFAALLELGYAGISVSPEYRRVDKFVPSEETSTVILNQSTYQFAKNEVIAQQFLTGAKAIYTILNKPFSGRIYTPTVNLNADIFGVIAKNAAPLTQLYMKYALKTKLTAKSQKYEDLFREKNYAKLLRLAVTDRDVDTVKKVLSLHKLPEADSKLFDIPRIIDLYDWLNIVTYFTETNATLANELATIAVRNGDFEIFKLFVNNIDNWDSLGKIAKYFGHRDISEYIDAFFNVNNLLDRHARSSYEIQKIAWAIAGKQDFHISRFEEPGNIAKFVGWTIQDGDLKTLLKLIEYSKDKKIINISSLLMSCIRLPEIDFEIFRYIYGMKSDWDESDKPFIVNQLMYFGMLDELIKYKNYLGSINEESVTFAMKFGHTECIKLLFDTVPGYYISTGPILQYASKEVLEYLFESGHLANYDYQLRGLRHRSLDIFNLVFNHLGRLPTLLEVIYTDNVDVLEYFQTIVPKSKVYFDDISAIYEILSENSPKFFSSFVKIYPDVIQDDFATDVYDAGNWKLLHYMWKHGNLDKSYMSGRRFLVQLEYVFDPYIPNLGRRTPFELIELYQQYLHESLQMKELEKNLENE
jgi:hypothetical protein